MTISAKIVFQKYRKKILWTTVALLLVTVLLNVPAFFKKEVEAKLLETIKQRINASVTYSQLSFSSLQNFPHTTLIFHHLTVVGQAPFEGDTLLYTEEFALSFDILSLIQGEKIELNSIVLYKPDVRIKINAKGIANYDIIKADTLSEASQDSSSIELKLDVWKIKDGTISYKDYFQKQYITLEGLYHKGAGDFKADRSDLFLFFDLKKLSYQSGKVSWFKNKPFHGEVVVDMDFKNNRFTFKDHDLKLSNLTFGINGYIATPKAGLDMDLTWDLGKSSFSDLLSILPGIYQEEVKKLKATGNLECKGYIKGLLSSTTTPAYGMALKIDHGLVAFPGLPQSFTDIHLTLDLKNTSGVDDSLEINIKQLTMKMGNHPINGRLKMKGINRLFVDAEFEGQLKLEELTAFYPLKGITLKGDLYSDITVNGYYDAATHEMPLIDASLSFEKGYICDSLYPAPIENIEFWATVENKGGSLKDTKINLGRLAFSLEDDSIEMAGIISDLTDPLFDVRIQGEVDLGKTLAHFNLGDTKVKGRLLAAFESSGRWSYIEKKNFKNLEVSGYIEARDLSLQTSALPYPLQIHDAIVAFYPDRIQLDTFYSTYGSSKMLLTGHLLDPYAFMLEDTNRVLTGDLALICDTLNLNEFSVESSTTSTGQPDTSFSAIEIPDHINFIFDTKIKTVIMEGITLSKLDGELILKDKTLLLTKSSFMLAGSVIECFGEYDTHLPHYPFFDMSFLINELDIARTYREVPLARKLAPAAAEAHGKLSLTYTLKGNFDKNMNLLFPSLIGKGTMDIEEAAINGIKMMEAVSKATGRDDLHQEPMKGVFIQSEIKNGKMHLAPFTFTTGRYVLEIEGNHSFDNEMNYTLHVSMLPLAKIRVPVHITGTTDDYKIKLGGGYDHRSLTEADVAK